ncbi:MAG: hypothetical protein ACRDI2_24855 [Chloroflexota bacterium]
MNAILVCEDLVVVRTMPRGDCVDCAIPIADETRSLVIVDALILHLKAASPRVLATVVGFLKERLPDPIAGQIDGVISGSGEGSGSPMDKVGSMFGGDDG